MEDERRDALRKFVANEVGEELIEMVMKGPGAAIDAWNEENRL